MARRGFRPAPLSIAAAVCLGLALASLALPSGPTYDPYAWLIWGRDLAHLTLVTRGGGTSWKPLPALVAAVLTPLGGGQADGWLVVARGGALFAIFTAFWLPWRLAPRRYRALAGAIGAATLALTHEFISRPGMGNAEGLMVALGLLAVDRHLAGRRGRAFALIVTAGLIRVEIWPFAALYALWLWWASKGRARTRLGVAFGALAIPLLWFGGDWLGSGHLTTAADRALRVRPGTAPASPHPALVVAREAAQMLPLPAWIALAAALLLAAARIGPRLAGRPAERRAALRSPEAVVLALAASAGIWVAVVAAMAQRGYAGSPRFLFMADGLVAVVAGVGAAWIAAVVAPGAAAAGTAARPGLRSSAGGALASVTLLAWFAYGAAPNAGLVPTQFKDVSHIAQMDAGLARAIRSAGGSAAVLRCGEPTTPWYAVTALAYDLGVGSRHVQDAQIRPMPRRRIVFRPIGRTTTWHFRTRDCARNSQPENRAAAGSPARRRRRLAMARPTSSTHTMSA